MVQIVIPMSGQGARFQQAGYADPKPLISVDGFSMIEHVTYMFPGEDKFLFICNQDHLTTTELKAVLKEVAPTGQVAGIPSHKLGPVFALYQAMDQIVDDEEVVVSYCDYSSYWSWQNFLADCRKRKADGAITVYRGFHPHMLGSDNYAFCRERAVGEGVLNENEVSNDKIQDRWLAEIQEKKPFTDDKMSEYASNGCYYFRTGRLLKELLQQMLYQRQKVNGEYYVSMLYNLLLEKTITDKENKTTRSTRVSLYPIQHMLQWGTPYDLSVYQQWSDYFRRMVDTKQVVDQSMNRHPPGTTTLLPLAGRGSRFTSRGYQLPKPLLPINGEPMVAQAIKCLPATDDHVFVCLQEHLEEHPTLVSGLRTAYPDCQMIAIDQVTEGQACTCELGIQKANLSADHPLLITACDNGASYDTVVYQQLLADESIDGIIWSFQQTATSQNNPHMYSWLVTGDPEDSRRITQVSVKKLPDGCDPGETNAIIGTMFFRRTSDFLTGLQTIYQQNIRTNGEFYVDDLLQPLIDQGKKLVVFPVDYYLCWGTADDYQTFLYWQSFFQKCSWHPYQLFDDQSRFLPITAPEIQSLHRELTNSQLVKFSGQSAVLMYHQGWGDIISCHGLVRYYAQQYQSLIVISRADSQPLMEYMFSDLLADPTRILKFDYLPFNQTSHLTHLNQYCRQKYPGAELIGFGYFSTLTDESANQSYNQRSCHQKHFDWKGLSFAHRFYYNYGLDLSIRVNYFQVPRQLTVEEAAYQKLVVDAGYQAGQYLVIHDDPARDHLIDRARLPNSLPIINLNGLSNCIFDLLLVVERAAEIHLIDSTWSLVLYHLYHSSGFLREPSTVTPVPPVPPVLIHKYVRPTGRDYRIYDWPSVSWEHLL